MTRSIACRYFISILILLCIIFQEIPAVSAKSDVLQWNLLDTPGSDTRKNDIVRSSEINRFALSHDDKTIYAIDRANVVTTTGGKALYKSIDNGISWIDDPGKRLYQSMPASDKVNFRVWNIAICPDNSNFIAVVTNSTTIAPNNVWISIDGGSNWDNTRLSSIYPISTIDFTTDYVNHYIAVGTRSGDGLGTIYILKLDKISSWKIQPFSGDILALKWSPNFESDHTIITTYSNNTGTFLNIGIYDPAVNTTNWNIIFGNTPPEITTGGNATSARVNQITGADLDLPQDFSGQAPSLRRVFISIDSASVNSGIYRIDDNHVYWLLTASLTKRIASIAYYGTYASGKLLAGEVLGETSKAAAMTWFTDAPNTCPITCWYPSIKPTTGAAGTESCSGLGYCNAQVEWSADGNHAYAATATTATLIPGITWYVPFLTGRELDESAFSRSNNNGQTWNQLSLIDTKIDYFSDMAPSAKSTLIYLSSSNNSSGCAGFDSVWKSVGIITNPVWERVLCKPIISNAYTNGQNNTSVLQIPGDSPDGQYVFVAARGTSSIYWSPDYGDYWTIVNTRLTIQDIAAEDIKTLYILDPTGNIQKMGFNGTSWNSAFIKPTGLESTYSVASAFTATTPDNERGYIIIGGAGTGSSDIAYSTNGGKTFTEVKKLLPVRGNTMVIASSSFKSDGGILAINSSGMYNYSIYSGEEKWEEWWGGQAWPDPVTALAISRNYGFYFNTPGSSWSPATPYVRWSAANSGLDSTVLLGNSGYPNRKIRICGGLESNEPINIFIVDQREYNYPSGGIWYYIDTLAWAGPLPTSPVSQSPVNFDPVSGRNGQIHLTWKPLSLSRGYRIQIAKDGDFRLLITDIGNKWGGPFYTPHDSDTPALIIPSGGGTIKDSNDNTWRIPSLEAGHTYYWRIKVQDVYTGDAIASPWSWRETFIINNGFIVNTPAYGLQLLQPAPGFCSVCIQHPSFSWTIYKNTDKYQFQLSEFADMSHPVISTEVPTSAYQYNGSLKANKQYFWRVRSISQYPSDWSPIGTFTTIPDKLVTRLTRVESTPIWVWAMIVLGLLWASILLVLIIRRR